LGLAVLVAAGAIAEATVKMQNDAKKLGFVVANCHYCHSSASAEAKMEKKARDLGLSSHNCIQCHGEKLPDKLNARGQWLVSEQKRRGAKKIEMAWLEDYKEAQEKREKKDP
jgi:hypothetical protein